MLQMGLFKSDGAVGLELDTGTIRAVELAGTGHAANLAAAGQIGIPDDAVVEGVVADPGAVADALRQLWNQAGLRSRNVVLGVSNQGLLMRMANLPRVPEKKLAQLMQFQAGDYFPIPLPQLVFDFAVVGEINGENGPEQEILLVAARREQLNTSLAALESASLQPVVVDASPLALMRTVTEVQLTGTVAMLDISNGLSTLLLASGGIPRFARVIPHSLQGYARERGLPLSELLEGNRQVAAAGELLLAKPGDTGSPGDWGMVLAAEVRSSIEFYLAQRSDTGLDLVVLSGRGALIGGITEFFRSQLEVPVEVVEPLAVITGPVEAGGVDLRRCGPEFAVSIGLAMRGLEA